MAVDALLMMAKVRARVASAQLAVCRKVDPCTRLPCSLSEGGPSRHISDTLFWLFGAPRGRVRADKAQKQFDGLLQLLAPSCAARCKQDCGTPNCRHLTDIWHPNSTQTVLEIEGLAGRRTCAFDVSCQVLLIDTQCVAGKN
jgi:hypothetical protein